MTISGPSIGRAGDDFRLKCDVTVVEHLIDQTIVHVEWIGGSLSSPNCEIEHNGNCTLMFNPLLPSHGAKYTCQAEINISSIDLFKISNDNRNIIVQSKLSIVCISLAIIYKPINTGNVFFTLQFFSLM